MTKAHVAIALIAVAVSHSVRAQIPNTNASPPSADAAAIAEFQQAKRTLQHFQTESAVEFMKIKNYHELLVAEGRITHKFQTADGKLIHCIEIGSQRSITNAGLSPKDIKLSPEVLPFQSGAPNHPSFANPPNFGLDGTVDTEGNVRRCPAGSIPILIPSLEDLCRFRKFQDLFRKYPARANQISSAAISRLTETPPATGPSGIEPLDGSVIHEYAHAYSITDNQGEQADFNVWRPTVEQANEFSLSQLWVVRPSSDVPARQSVETGWQVSYNQYGDSEPHLFIYSTTHNYDMGYAGGYNLGAGLFVQTDSTVIIGGRLTSSTIGGPQYGPTLMYYRDQGGSHDWWLKYGDTWVGYYPNSWYNSSGIADKSAIIDYGGEIINANIGGVHTTTDMGSGHFPNEGWQHSAFIKHMTYLDMNNVLHNADNLNRSVTNASYYDLLLYSISDPAWANYFYFGGPGATSTVPTAITNPPSNVTSTSATFHGTVNPNGLSTIVHFEYGRTANYGSATPPQNAFSGTAPIPVQVTFTDLSPSTPYHYRMVAASGGGASNGNDVSFRTNSSAFDVTNTNSQGVGSLLDALSLANSTSSLKTITFNLPGPGPWTITTATTLSITAPVVIDGSSQPGYDGGLNRVYVEGTFGISNVFALVGHGGTTIKGLGIYNYDNVGVAIGSTANWNFVDDCYIGFKNIGTGIQHNTSRAPSSAGVEIRGSYNKVRRTTISGVYSGINIGEPIEQATGLVSHDNLFEYNRIGTNPTGQTTVGYENTSTGILLRAGVQSSWIGGYNVIAGNGGSGVEIVHPSSYGNRIYYNYFGVNDGGTKVIDGRTNDQAILFGNIARNNGAWGNVVAGNRKAGIIVSSGDGNWIWNNTIGLNQSQTAALGGQPSGIVLNVDAAHSPGASPVRNSIQGNMVCNQSLNGIELYNGVGNGIYNNWIGTNSAGQFFPNAGWGVYLQDSSYNTGFGNAWGQNGLGRVGQSGGTGNSIQ